MASFFHRTIFPRLPRWLRYLLDSELAAAYETIQSPWTGTPLMPTEIYSVAELNAEWDKLGDALVKGLEAQAEEDDDG